MISFGKAEYLSQMKEIWHSVFGDSFDYINRFFHQLYKPENSLIYLEQDRVAAILFIIPYDYISGSEKSSAAYLYALATLPKFRGRGIMSRMVVRANQICRQRGYAFSVLIPASESLFEYYKKLGFETAFYRTEIRKTREELLSHNFQSVSDANILIKYECAINPDISEIHECYEKKKAFQSGGIVLSRVQNEFYIRELEKEGGEVLLLSMEKGEKRYVFLTMEGDVIHLWETNIAREEVRYLFQLLLDRYRFRTVVFYQSDYLKKDELLSSRKAFGMIYKLIEIDLSNPFMNRVCM